MSKVLGYGLMIIGILLIAANLLFKTTIEKIPFLAKLNILWVLVVGLILVVAGFLFTKDSSSSSKVQYASEEVPIYHGEGKNKRIVGYKRTTK